MCFLSLSVSAADIKCLYPLERVNDSRFVLNSSGNPIYSQTMAIVPPPPIPTIIKAVMQYTNGVPNFSYGLQPIPAAPTYQGYNVNGCKGITAGGTPYNYFYTWNSVQQLLYADSQYVDSNNNNYPVVIKIVFFKRSNSIDGITIPSPPISIN